LKASLDAVPTTTARETLALLYQRVGNRGEAVRLADEVASNARRSGDAVQLARAERLIETVTVQPARAVSEGCPSDAGLVGSKLTLPAGGDDFETATLVTPCVYRPQVDIPREQKQYYKVSLRAGQVLGIVMRLRGSNSSNIWITLHGPDGGHIDGRATYGDSSKTDPLEYKPAQAGPAYFTLSGAVEGAALQIAVN
jgi:hypothetical protein